MNIFVATAVQLSGQKKKKKTLKITNSPFKLNYINYINYIHTY